MSNIEIEIVEFSDERSEQIKTLNYEWLEKYFRIEKGDVISLSNPKEQIIEKGGFIYYAKLNNDTPALLPISQGRGHVHSPWSRDV
ncbi:MAG: hypothetical protein OEX02_15075 [Cyclobacteriaceae bacterium]|nr:hypothetical protein [Cyclobacteriaceae bacterium]